MKSSFSSDMVEKGKLADKLEKRSNELKAWLVSLDVLKILEGIVQLMRTVIYSLSIYYYIF